jgi:hypothetical protein
MPLFSIRPRWTPLSKFHRCHRPRRHRRSLPLLPAAGPGYYMCEPNPKILELSHGSCHFELREPDSIVWVTTRERLTPVGPKNATTNAPARVGGNILAVTRYHQHTSLCTDGNSIYRRRTIPARRQYIFQNKKDKSRSRSRSRSSLWLARLRRWVTGGR